MRASLAELGVAQGGEVFALAPPYLSSSGRAPSRCSRLCDCSKWTLCKKTPFVFSPCKALAVSHRSSFCSGLAAARYWRASGRTAVLSSHRLWQPLWRGQTFTAQRGLRLAVYWGCWFPPEAFVCSPASSTVRRDKCLHLVCLPRRESPGARQFGEFWGRWGLDQFLLSSSCAATRVHDFRSVFHLIALGVYFWKGGLCICRLSRDRFLLPRGSWQTQLLGEGELVMGQRHGAETWESCDRCPDVQGTSCMPLSSHHISLYLSFCVMNRD